MNVERISNPTEEEAMAENVLHQLEARIQNDPSIGEKCRRKLSRLLPDLRQELSQLSMTHREQAQNIAGLARLSTDEAFGTERNADRLKASLERLKRSVEEFEKSHPRLVQAVGALSNMLASMGI